MTLEAEFRSVVFRAGIGYPSDEDDLNMAAPPQPETAFSKYFETAAIPCLILYDHLFQRKDLSFAKDVL